MIVKQIKRLPGFFTSQAKTGIPLKNWRELRNKYVSDVSDDVGEKLIACGYCEQVIETDKVKKKTKIEKEENPDG